jgi:ribonuclease Z
MTDHIEKAWAEDVRVRINGLEQADRTGYKVVVHEISPGIVYRDSNVTVTAFPVKHGTWKEAFGYRFDTKDRRIVISGDTAPTEEVVRQCDGCDLLLHEVYNPNREEEKTPHWKEYFETFHTSPQATRRYCTAGASQVAGALSPGFGRAAGVRTDRANAASLRREIRAGA